MTVKNFTKEQAKVFNAIVIRGAIFPSVEFIILAILLLLPIFLLLPSDPKAGESTGLGILVLAAIPITVLSTYLIARFAMPKSLFKLRRRGQLVPIASPRNYVRRWMWVCLATQLMGGLVMVALVYMGITPPDLSAVMCFLSCYVANYLVAQKMIANGDAELKLKSQE